MVLWAVAVGRCSKVKFTYIRATERSGNFITQTGVTKLYRDNEVLLVFSRPWSGNTRISRAPSNNAQHVSFVSSIPTGLSGHAYEQTIYALVNGLDSSLAFLADCLYSPVFSKHVVAAPNQGRSPERRIFFWTRSRLVSVGMLGREVRGYIGR